MWNEINEAYIHTYIITYFQVYDKNKIDDISPEQVIDQFKKTYKDYDFDLIFGESDEYDTLRKVRI